MFFSAQDTEILRSEKKTFYLRSENLQEHDSYSF